MKKLFALVLAVVMICAMSTSVFAVHENVVGDRPEAGNGTYEDGDTDNEFAADNPDIQVNITATAGNVEHRYAVDIEYDTMSFSVSGSNLVWNVNTLQYETAQGSTSVSDAEFNVQVINYSDLAVNLTVECTDTNANDYIAVACTQANGTVKIEDAIGYDAETVKADTSDAQKSFKVEVTSNDWVAAGNYYAEQFATNPGQTSLIVGTLTLTIAKVS